MRGSCTRVGVSAALCFAEAASGQSQTPAVFVANNVSGDVTSLTVNPDGTLSFVGVYPSSAGPQTIDLSPDGRHLVLGHGTADEVQEALVVFRVEADATLTPVLLATVPDSPLAARWLDDRVVAVTETNVGPPNYVHTYRVDTQVPALTLLDTESTGSFNTSLALLPGGSVLYAQDSTGYMISWFDVAAGGQLAPGGSIATGAAFPLELAVTHGGTFLYAAGGISNGGHSVLGFSIGAEGDLSALGGSPFFSPGQSPAHLAVGADDSWLFVGHGTDATVRSFSIDPESGAITPTGYVFDVGLQGTLGDLAVLGDLLLVTDESTAIDGIAGIYSFGIEPDGSLSLNGPIVGTQGVRPESVAVWSPPPAPVPGDLDGDGVVGIADLLALLSAWGPCPLRCPPSCSGDLDGDCAVGIADLLALLGNWG